MDHRSVNLATGVRSFVKKTFNQILIPFVHIFSGNPLAVKTNYFFNYKDKFIYDLGHNVTKKNIKDDISINYFNIWYIGSMKPNNRNGTFLLNIFDKISQLNDLSLETKIHIAGTVNKKQLQRIKKNRKIVYYGKIPRNELYKLILKNRGVGVAYMNEINHQYAPAIKFVEFGALGLKILASNTFGLRLQKERTKMPNVTFVDHDCSKWVEAIKDLNDEWDNKVLPWENKDKWSYSYLFENQVIKSYLTILNG